MENPWPTLVSQAQHHSHLHFACHAVHDPRDPTRSALLLGPLVFNTAEILTFLSLAGVELVTLSACETGLTDLRAAEEFVGLPAAFLEAGAQAVASTLWSVDDLSTAVLMAEFYRRHIKRGQHVAVALRDSQQWLRAATTKELGLAELWQRLLDASGGRDGMALRALRHCRAHPDEKPFEHPYYWAAFVIAGAPETVNAAQ